MSLSSGNGRWLVAGAAGAAAGYALYQYSRRKRTKTTGPSNTGRRYKGIPIPFYFLEDSAEAFHNMRVDESDVFMASLGKSGTTWVNKILFLILKGVDDDGGLIPSANALGKDIQAYPEGLPMQKGEGKAAFLWGDATLPDLFAQPGPRLFSTHLYGDLLPAQLTDPNHGTGKIVLVLRNVKDILASLHFFNGEAKDGWHGNEHGAGSLARYIAADCPNAYGSVFEVITAFDKLAAELEGTGRIKVVYFEALKADLCAELDSLAEFLERPLTPAKKAAILEAVVFKAMQTNDKKRGILLRKGAIGDWRNHLDAESWARVDEAFERGCGSCALAQPLKQYH